MAETFHPADSTNVHKAEYDAASGTLTVHFKSGGIYDYQGVPPDVFLGMQTAQSVGGYVHRVLKGKYEHARRGD